MKKILLSCVLLAFSLQVVAQSEEEKNSSEESVFIIVEKMPEFKGGTQALYKFLSDNLKYPKEERKAGEQGVVYATFVIETDGSVSNVKVIRGASPALDAEAVRVLEMMPAWEPGTQKNEAVRVQFTIPVNFKL